MNDNLNLCEILKGCPKGTKLYSTVYGHVEFDCIEEDYVHSVIVKIPKNDSSKMFTSDGRLYTDYDGECILFPSKEQRDWSKFKVTNSKFDPSTLQPFDKVLVIDGGRSWTPLLFTKLNYSLNYPRMLCFDLIARKVVPYNEETKHLLGTTDEAPEYYRYWEY